MTPPENKTFPPAGAATMSINQTSDEDSSGTNTTNEKPCHSDDNTPSSDPAAASPKPLSPPPPPNGGVQAWLQVFGAFFLNVNTWGLLNTFGVASSQSAISWIGAVQAFLMLVVGVVCGRALDAGYFYADVAVGIFLAVFGTMMTSISSEYWQVFLAQGVVVGLGAGMCFMPAVAIVGTYFSTRRSTAMGICATGSSVGGIVYPILLKTLIASMGWRWATRVMGFVMLGTLLISVSVMRTRLPPRKSGPFINTVLLREPTTLLWFLAVFFILVGLYVPFFYVESYALNMGVDPDLASYLVILMNATSIPGRLFPSIVADRTGNLSIMIPAVLSQPSLVAVSALFGFTSGSIQAVLPANVAYLCPDLSMLGTNLGMTLFSARVGLLIGNPIAGAILDQQSSGRDHAVFWGSFAFAGAVVIVGGLLLIAVRVMKVGWGLAKG
ncbi:putative monocarboxylate permease [Podospora appendiculata]|uniref:Monocarboxylate permease n=1 Tax=Podospora appendiculata TaxID=314037 RepID=A0AAE0X237_9PEZI|nr:putative monocarboxylate permease [Podospora appendiculata]